MCGVGLSHAASGAHSWCIWLSPCPHSASWGWQSWRSGWVPVAEASSDSITTAIF